MNAFVAIASLIAAANAGVIAPAPAAVAVAASPYATTVSDAGYGPSTIVRAPEHDSASIEHHRFGGNFAYSTAEAHAFARVTPKLQTLTHPVAETINTHIPEVIETRHPAPIVRTTHVAQAIHQDVPIHADQPIVGPVAARTTVHQPVFKTQQIHHSAIETPIVAPVKAPVVSPVIAKAAPVAVATAPAALGYAATGYAANGYAATGLAANGYVAGAPAGLGLAGVPAIGLGGVAQAAYANAYAPTQQIIA